MGRAADGERHVARGLFDDDALPMQRPPSPFDIGADVVPPWSVKKSDLVLEEALRNLGSSAVGLVGGGTEKGGMVKLSEKQQIPVDGALLDPARAMDAIVAQLHKWARSGAIDATFGA